MFPASQPEPRHTDPRARNQWSARQLFPLAGVDRIGAIKVGPGLVMFHDVSLMAAEPVSHLGFQPRRSRLLEVQVRREIDVTTASRPDSRKR